MEAATTKSDGGHRGEGVMGLKISGGPQGGWTGEDGKEDGLWVGGGKERGGAEKQVETSSRRRRPTTTTLISGCEACPRRPTTLLPPTTPATPHPALPLTANYRISLDRAPKCRPLFARRSKYLSRDIYYHYTNKGVTAP